MKIILTVKIGTKPKLLKAVISVESINEEFANHLATYIQNTVGEIYEHKHDSRLHNHEIEQIRVE